MLIVVPLSTLPHWVRELSEWTTLDVVVFYGNKEARLVILKHEFTTERKIGLESTQMSKKKKSSAVNANLPLPKFDVCVTTYEMLTANPEALRHVRWEYMIVDEAHRLKNRDAKALAALRELTCVGTWRTFTMRALAAHVWFLCTAEIRALSVRSPSERQARSLRSRGRRCRTTCLSYGRCSTSSSLSASMTTNRSSRRTVICDRPSR